MTECCRCANKMRWEEIRERRLERGWTLREAALRMGLPLSTYARVEKGKSRVKPMTLWALELVFGFTFKELWDANWRQEMNTNEEATKRNS